ncbi:hypothetical protein GGR58DRAFT_167097 [Xylaria digitata]|nr:hypothetical protein GGR58DRAFT_167097 [Xylaria digitata]
MPSSNGNDGGHLAPPPPPTPRISVRSAQNATQATIMIEPTQEYQRFWNQTRREMDRQRLEFHVTENNLEPPQAEPMSRSTTSDSHPSLSPSTVCSHVGDSITPLSSPDPASEGVRSRPTRGRRRGPLELETRTKTAFKRKFKLTCARHRAKRVTCNCHDFSKLEDGYQRSLAAEAQKAKASRSQPVRSLVDHGTFGAGGAGATAPTTPHYKSFHLSDLPIGHEFPHQVNASLLPALELDIHSAASVNAIVSAPREETFFLAPPAPVSASVPVPMQNSIIIGRSTLFRNRWECEYKFSTKETGSRGSTGSCSWTGPLQDLEAHFKTAHHPFEQPLLPHWTTCEECDATIPEWGGRACSENSKCRPDSSKKLLYGDLPRQPKPSPPILTVSQASGSRSSWLNPSWDMGTLGSSNTGHCSLPYSSSIGRSGFYEHSASGNEDNETDNSEGKNDSCHRCGRTQSRYRYQPDTADMTPYRRIASRPPLVKRTKEYIVACYDPHLNLPLPSRLYQHLILSLLTSLIIFHLRGRRLFITLRSALFKFFARIQCLKWYLASIIFVFLGVWIAMGSLGSRASREDGLRTLMLVA